jgi:choline dehydrogenase-like flavoprotein
LNEAAPSDGIAVTFSLSARQRAVLHAVCDTLLPSLTRDDDPARYYATGALAAGTPARVEQMLGLLTNPHDQARLKLLLAVLDSSAMNLAVGGGFRSFADMDPPTRERVLTGLAHSSITLRRAGFQALKRLCHVAYFCFPPRNGRHPAWDAVGYPGPLPQPEVVVPPLTALAVDSDATLDADVVIVGSGAGGGVVAGLLTAAGRDVVVLEKGGNPSSRDLTQAEGEVFNDLYLDRGMIMTDSGSMPILAGSCLGGGTVINWTTSFALPGPIGAEWDRRSGLTLFESPGFRESLARVQARLDVGIRWTTPSRRDQLFEAGVRALDWPVEPIPRNVTGCLEGLECGFCTFGCRHGAKNSTASTYLHDAAAGGARLVPHCTVERILVEGGRAVGVRGTVCGSDGRSHAITVRARAVVVACGAIWTPVLLRLSGLANPHIGRNLHLHPVSAMGAYFPERVEPWGGAMQTRCCAQFADMDGEGYGARFETGPIHFALPASAFGWANPRQLRDDVGRLAHMGHVGILLRDRDAGRVVPNRWGHPRVLYDVSKHDAANMRRALEASARIMAAAGAEELFTLQTPPSRCRPGGAGWLERFLAQADATGYRRLRMSYVSFHQMGTAAMAADPARGAVDGDGRSFDVKGLYVADGSTFPAPSGVNPMITIMAVADHVARALDAAL